MQHECPRLETQTTGTRLAIQKPQVCACVPLLQYVRKLSATAAVPLTYWCFHGFRSCLNTWKEQSAAVGYPGGHHLPWRVPAAPLGRPPHLWH